MVEKKPDAPAPAADIVQRYRFRVRTADGRELISQVATVTRPAPLGGIVPKVPPEEAKQPPAGKPAPAAAPAKDVPVHRILVSVKGARQGLLAADPGLSDAAGKAPAHQFAVLEFTFATRSPRDPASGLPTGKRMHEPVRFTKEVGPSTPQLYAALSQNENLPEVVLDCYGVDQGTGKLALAHSLTLVNANLAAIDHRMLNTRNPKLQAFKELEVVSLTFERIEWRGPGGVEAMDTWEAPTA